MKKYGVIIIAAGYSSRMAGFKPLLKFGRQTAVERVVALYQQAGADQIILVLGHRADQIRPYFDNQPVDVVVNKNFADGMYTSIVTGVTHLNDEIEAFFIHPVDIPLVKRETIKELMAAPPQLGKGIIYPSFLGERGHPPLIDTKYRRAILDNKQGGGLKRLLALYEIDAAELPLIDEAILMDMDTRADYEALLTYDALEAPNLCECYAIWEKYQLPENIRRHCQKVKQTASGLVDQLIKTGETLNRPLIQAAALLHDLAKTEKKHAEKGGEILKAMGYPQVGAIIAVHMDILVEADTAITESEILYLADKLVKNDQLIDLTTRKNLVLQTYRDNPQALEKITRRYRNAEIILQKIQRKNG
ncbi:DVU_1551 family NTP transferase [Acetobacterium wieringae]|uniref:DVU_1551 family NTP transferase n=1 Tax=Acetobacterium wieringae TaxID=52694 RepID=UPI0026F1F035|nr:NTP transferase domain-containing protein [Acetobacterium wieringae]